MFKTFAIVSVLTSAAFAQSSSSSAAAATSTANPYIPTGISQSCTTFLNELNTDSSLTSCLSALSTATSPFAPGSTVSPTEGTVKTALQSLCSDSIDTVCSENLIRSKIASFYTACAQELTTNQVPDVIRTYDVLYTLSPMRTSACSKSDDGSWCVMAKTVSTSEVSEAVSSSSTLGLSQLLALLYTNNGSALKRRAQVSAIVPNMTTYHDSNLPFLFFNPTLDAEALCTSCTRSVLTAYINFESNIPYAPGLSSSQLLDTQSALYNAITEKCPANFLNNAVQAAGGISQGGLFSGAVSTLPEHRSLISLALGAATLAASFAL
ncbi:unnamed protein product [Cyclocybe aegerita]|uniref:DUF7729 domain-containing protein n=1 Tax=Cyclocybe aegerita TaxID=1973307 RepID=A0A8S0W988_CYCAE|nr:unnamed protein product [Cyclocybe aegerita]